MSSGSIICIDGSALVCHVIRVGVCGASAIPCARCTVRDRPPGRQCDLGKHAPIPIVLECPSCSIWQNYALEHCDVPSERIVVQSRDQVKIQLKMRIAKFVRGSPSLRGGHLPCL